MMFNSCQRWGSVPQLPGDVWRPGEGQMDVQAQPVPQIREFLRMVAFLLLRFWIGKPKDPKNHTGPSSEKHP